MSVELERQLRERLQRADLPRASQELRVSLESVVRTPVDRRNGRDRRNPLRVLAIAAVIAGGGLAVFVAGGGIRNTALIPYPAPTPQVSAPPSTPSEVPMLSPLALAEVAGLPVSMASTCVDSAGAIQDIASVGTAITCSANGVTVDVAQVAVVDESGDPVTATDVWNRLAYRPLAAAAGELPWVRSDKSICSSQESASYSDYAVGTRPAGRIGGCADDGWLIWTIDRHEIVARIETSSGSLADAVSWFRTNRPVGGLSGLVWEVPWYACQEAVPDSGCDGPLPAELFEAIWRLARPVSFEELQALSEEATETRDRELVRLTGRVAFGFVDDGWTGIEVRQISSTSWDQPVMIPDAFLVGPQNGDIIDVVGWVGERFAMPGDSGSSPAIQPSPGSSLPGSLPHVDVAAYRPAN